MHVKHDFSSDESYWKGDPSLFPSFLLLVLTKVLPKKDIQEIFKKLERKNKTPS